MSLSNNIATVSLSAGVTVRDVAVDSMTGHIFFTGIHVLKSMNSGGIIYQIPVTVIRIHSMTIDAFNRQV